MMIKTFMQMKKFSFSLNCLGVQFSLKINQQNKTMMEKAMYTIAKEFVYDLVSLDMTTSNNTSTSTIVDTVA